MAATADRAWVAPCALLPVAFGTYSSGQCFGARALFLLGGFAGLLVPKQSTVCGRYGATDNKMTIIWLALMQRQ